MKREYPAAINIDPKLFTSVIRTTVIEVILKGKLSVITVTTNYLKT